MVLFLLSIAFVSTWFKRIDYRLSFFLGLISIIILYSNMNVNKAIEGDWAWYTEHYTRLQHMDLGDYLGARIKSSEGPVTIKSNEPIYYSFAKALSVISNGNVSVLAIVMTASDYILMGLAMLSIGSSLAKSLRINNNGLVLLSCVALSITFTLVTQLVRQEFSISIAAVGYAALLRRRFILATIIAAISVLTHQSSIIFIIILYTPVIIEMFAEKSWSRRLAFLGFALCMALAIGYYIAHSSASALGMKDDGSVSSGLIAFDGVLIATLAVITAIGNYNFYRLAALQTCILFYATLATLYSLPLAALRLYFYMDFIRAVCVLTILLSLTPRRYSHLIGASAGFSLLIVVLGYSELRVERSPFHYNGDVFDYLIEL